MKTEKLFIQNRDGKRIAVLVNTPENPRGLAFVAHGLGGSKNESQIALFASCFVEASFIAIRWDARNTFGESEGQYEDATTTNYLEDMEDVIAWARTQSWFGEPFVLCGHSLGGFCSLIYAERHPKQVRALAPIASVVSGEMSMRAKIERFGEAQMNAWKQAGWIETIGSKGNQKRLRYAEVEDRMKYDTLRAAHLLTMPVLLAAGENDESTPLWTQEKLLAALPGPKELHGIAGAKHTYPHAHELAQLESIFQKWLKSTFS
jgi:pimeloyl-ACP methyl ester carboxylesterase